MPLDSTSTEQGRQKSAGKESLSFSFSCPLKRGHRCCEQLIASRLLPALRPRCREMDCYLTFGDVRNQGGSGELYSTELSFLGENCKQNSVFITLTNKCADSIVISDPAELTAVYCGLCWFSSFFFFCPSQSCQFSKSGFNTINKFTLELADLCLLDRATHLLCQYDF